MFLICGGMYRSCSTWQYQVAGAVLDFAQCGHSSRTMTFENVVEIGSVPRGKSRRAWVLSKSHEGSRHIAAGLEAGGAKALYSYRDVRDVFSSLAHKFSLPFETLLSLGMFHQVMRNDAFWRAQPNVLVQSYERLTGDPVDCVREIADHLEIHVPAAEAARIASLFSLEENKKRAQALATQLIQSGIDLSQPQNSLIGHRDQLLHWNHIRSGKNGTWRDDITPYRAAAMLALCGDWLVRNRYETDSHWASQADRLAYSPRERAALEIAMLRGSLASSARLLHWNYPGVMEFCKQSFRWLPFGGMVWNRVRKVSGVAVYDEQPGASAPKVKPGALRAA